MNCTKCHKEFTDSDKSERNWKEYMGEYSHKVCPGITICTVCNSEIADYSAAKKTPANLGTGWMHKTCTFKVQNMGNETQAQPSSWIVK